MKGRKRTDQICRRWGGTDGDIGACSQLEALMPHEMGAATVRRTAQGSAAMLEPGAGCAIDALPDSPWIFAQQEPPRIVSPMVHEPTLQHGVAYWSPPRCRHAPAVGKTNPTSAITMSNALVMRALV